MGRFSKWLWGLVVPAVIIMTIGLAQARGLYDKPPELDRLIEELLISNQELLGMQEELAALEAEIDVAGAMDDPRLGIGVANLPTDTFSFSQEPMTQKTLFIAQKFPWFGKLDLRTQRAVVAVERQRAVIEARRLDLVKALAATYYDLGFVAESLRVNAELFQMVQQMLQVAEASYASGQGLQQDVFQAQVESGKLIDDRIDLEKRQYTLVARINELLNRPAYGEVQGPAEPAISELVLDPEAVQRWTLDHNPMLRIRQADIDRAVVNIDLARKNYYPDMDFNVAYGQRDEDMTGRDLPDFVSASVVVNLPLWQRQKQDKQLLAEENRHKGATKAYESLQHALPHQVDAVLNEIDAIQENMRLFGGGLLEQTANWSQSALSAYEVGKVDFDTMIKAHMRALQFQLQARRYRFQYATKLTELETLAGIALKDIARPEVSAPGAAGPAASGQARQTRPTPPHHLAEVNR